jgi:hypothetical protein
LSRDNGVRSFFGLGDRPGGHVEVFVEGGQGDSDVFGQPAGDGRFESLLEVLDQFADVADLKAEGVCPFNQGYGGGDLEDGGCGHGGPPGLRLGQNGNIA